MSQKPKGDAAWAQLEYEMAKRGSYEGMANAAWSGDKDQAMQLLRVAAVLLPTDPQAIPYPVREYLSACLLEILADEDPAKALNLTARKDRERGPDFWKLVRDADMAKAVAHLRSEGATREEAFAQVANDYRAFAREAGKVGQEAVRTAYQRFFPKDSGKR
jgi:hypothetical protein